VYVCTGVRTSNPWRSGTASTNTGTATTATVDVGSAVGDLVIDNLATGALNAGVSPTLGGGQTTMYNAASNGDNLDVAGSTEPGATTVTMSWTSLTGVESWAIIGGSLVPFTASPSSPILFQ
jgi:hypothetical protein